MRFNLAGGVEIGEPSQRLVGLIRVVGFVDLVELLKRASQAVRRRG